ncbi:uncharacterized protein BX664DRAFT_328088 [Halteromyces radiatus]|uniref:uncharacterized protein n=1 Tax=Halteromyces radiatus TaxID=101107 RepID=UPI00221F8219|nr:uncharacterized protein BX664DRAFT_328088 [Halteromyces radiatus]KAI8092766.1 hypothetical protein BX664DRAFT_328088 [Halteromyces radiatus]
MTVPTLHLLSTDQYAPLVEQLSRHHQPSCSQFLGWFLQTGHSTVDHLGRSKVYSTHSNPDYLPLDEPVVLVINSFHRLRIYVSTEPVFDNQGVVTESLKKQAAVGDWNGEKAPRLYDDDHLHVLYQKSVDLLEHVLHQVINEWGNNECMFHGVSLVWQPLISALYKIIYYGPCHTFVKPVETDIPIESPWPLSNLVASDVKTVVERNKILYDSKYVEDCFRISSALRDQGKLVAWAYTHRDLPIGGLHVIPEYRRRQLASIIVRDLCNKQSRFLLDNAPNSDQIQYYVLSLVEYSNPASTALFERLGFSKVGLGMTWTEISVRK